ncbi:ABC transporter substrate-binding protein [Mumia qirimensis]|uniref:ABC transporter substrate-binding protein n=1 Tax=Mumia qirimensis TaxID=3234852 RepID=UPI00351D05B2
MNNFKKTGIAAAAIALALSGCSTKSEAGAEQGSDGIKTGPGVTDSTITLGALTVASGPGASLGTSVLEGQQLIVDQVNADGGICDRDLELEVRDTALDPQRAVAAYNEIKGDVAGISQLLGSAPTAALVDSIEADEMLTLVGGFSADLLGYEHIQIPGSTYDIDMINGLTVLAKQAGLKKGDKVGHVFVEGEAGANALEGSTFAAKNLGLEIVEQQVAPTATDLTPQVSALKAAGVKAVLMTVLPPATASFVGVSAATGLRVPVLTNSVGWAVQLLGTPAAPALEKMLLIASPAAGPNSDVPEVKKFIADYTAANPEGKPESATLQGGTLMRMMVAALEGACTSEDLSREGITAALRKLPDFNSGVGTTLDFTSPELPPSTTTFLQKPSKAAVGGITDLDEGMTDPSVEDYLASKG